MSEFCQKLINSIFDSMLLFPRFNSKKILLVQSKRLFNSIVRDTGRKGSAPNLPTQCPKQTKKGDFSSKMANKVSKYDSFIHFTIKFNSKDYSISFFRNIQFQKLFDDLFPRTIQFKIDSKI